MRKLFDGINGIDLSGMPNLTLQEKRIIRASEGKESSSDKRFFKAKTVYNGIELPLKIPIAMFPDEVGDVCINNSIQRDKKTDKL